MASPFSVFRKNQKLMLAVLTILAMFGFVFLPIVLQNMGGEAAVNPVVVKTSKYGASALIHPCAHDVLCNREKRRVGRRRADDARLHPAQAGPVERGHRRIVSAASRTG